MHMAHEGDVQPMRAKPYYRDDSSDAPPICVNCWTTVSYASKYGEDPDGTVIFKGNSIVHGDGWRDLGICGDCVDNVRAAIDAAKLPRASSA